MNSAGLVSAHRCNDPARLQAALALAVDYVEFDLQLHDGTIVVAHDADGVPAIGYDEVLAALAGRARAHLDLKFVTDSGEAECAAVARAVAVLGADQVVVTTLHDATVRAVRVWAHEHAPALRIGLSLGRGVGGLRLRHQIAVRVSELLPGRRFRTSGADVVVAHRVLARLGVAWFARRHGLPLLVWTVDEPHTLRRWLRGRCWMVTTNEPALALALRESTS